MNLDHTGLVARWKKHQSAKSSSVITIPATPRDPCPHGIKEHLTWHLNDIEETLISKGKVDQNLMDKPLAQFKINTKNSKKGKSQSSHTTKMSLNKSEQV